MKTLNNKPGHAISPLTRKRMSDSAHRVPVNAYWYDSGTFVGGYDSYKAAAEALNVNPSNIRKVLNGARAHTKNYTFRLATKTPQLIKFVKPSTVCLPYCSFNSEVANA